MLRQTIRSLRRTPSFTFAALLCLALGIGATTAIFSIVNAVLFRPLPYPHPEQLTRLYTEFPDFPGGGLHKFWVSEPEVFELKKAHSFSRVGAWAVNGTDLAAGTEPVRVTTGYVSSDLLAELQIQPLLGRVISQSDDQPGAPKVVLLSYGEWKSLLGGDRSVIGRTVYLDGARATVIGVMPKGFVFPPGEIDPPLAWSALQLDPKSKNFGGHNFNVLARLRDGVTLAQARGEMTGIVTQLGKAESRMNHVLSAKDHPVTMYGFHDELIGGVRRSMYVLLGAVVFVLLIACVNVANLLLARSEDRQREIAVRRAVGASNKQLLAQFLTEGTLLSFSGALLGILLAIGGLQILAILNPGSIPMADSIQLDWRVMAFTAGVSILCGIVFGLAPMLQVSAIHVYETLKANSGRSTSSVASSRFRSVLVVVQMALSFVLLAGAGLMLQGFARLQSTYAGIDPHNVLTAQVSLPDAQYSKTPEQVAFSLRLQDGLNRIPGVRSATIAGLGLPPIRRVNDNTTEIEGFVPRPNGPINNIAYYQVVGERFFETLGARMIQGRELEPRDADANTHGVVINQAMARTFWPHENPLGHRIRPGGDGTPWFTIVGVVEDIKNGGLDKPVETEAFFPARVAGGENPHILIRTLGNPTSYAEAVRRVVRSIDPTVPVSKIQTMEDVMSAANARPRFLTVLMALFSGLALGLAMLGIYGLISYSVAQRTAEFGIRTALGASPGRLLWQVLWQGLTMGLVGWALGGICAVFLTRVLQGIVFGLGESEGLVWATAAVLLGLTTVAACYLPALRATRIQPATALRNE
jgi:putative ABC transport system permease protein